LAGFDLAFRPKPPLPKKVQVLGLPLKSVPSTSRI